MDIVYLWVLFTYVYCLPTGIVYLWVLFTYGYCLPMGIVYLWILFTYVYCLPMGIVYLWEDDEHLLGSSDNPDSKLKKQVKICFNLRASFKVHNQKLKILE